MADLTGTTEGAWRGAWRGANSSPESADSRTIRASCEGEDLYSASPLVRGQSRARVCPRKRSVAFPAFADPVFSNPSHFRARDPVKPSSRTVRVQPATAVCEPDQRLRLVRHRAPATRPKRLTEIVAFAAQAISAIDARSYRVTGLARSPGGRRRRDGGGGTLEP
jgi:hypothetical protein